MIAGGILIAAVGVLVVPVAATFVTAWRSLTPRREAETKLPLVSPARRDDVRIPGEAGDLRGWLVRPATPVRGTVVLMHGWGSSAARMLAWSRFLADAGWASLAFDAPGHGRTEGTARVTLPSLSRDVACAAAFVRRDPELGMRPLAVLGHSMGGAAVLLALSRGLDVQAAIISSAFARVEVLADHVLRRWYLPPRLFRPLVHAVWTLRTGESLALLEPEATVRHVRVPLLFTHGEADPIITDRELRRLTAAAPPGLAQVLVLPGAHHSDMPEFPEYRREVVAFLERHAAPSALAVPVRSD